MEIILISQPINNGPLAFQLNSSGLSTTGNCQVLWPVNNGYNPLNDVTDQAVDAMGKKHQRDGSPDIPTYIDVWLPSTIFRTWTTRGMSNVLMMGADTI